MGKKYDDSLVLPPRGLFMAGMDACYAQGERCIYCFLKSPHLESQKCLHRADQRGNERLWLVMTCFVSTASILIDSKRDAYAECPLGICRDHLSRRTSSTIHSSQT